MSEQEDRAPSDEQKREFREAAIAGYTQEHATEVLDARLAASEAEVERLKASIEEVRALADFWEREWMPTDSGWVEACHRALLAALPAPAGGESWAVTG